MAAHTNGSRRPILDKVLSVLDSKLACTLETAPDVVALRRAHEDAILSSANDDAFEEAMNAMLQTVGKTHLGFHHEVRPRAPARVALAASFTAADTPDGRRWVFQDVHPGGAAASAGFGPGDVLLTLGNTDLLAPASPALRLGTTIPVEVRKTDGSTRRAELPLPASKEKTRPVVVPSAVVTATTIQLGVGLIRISMFPGILGMDVARDTSRAVRELNAERLIIDLRGNSGGGIGGLRVMSHLTPDRRGVGYSVGRRLLRRGYDKNHLPRFQSIPTSKLGAIALIPRLGLARSVAVFSEALGAQRHHGRVAMLVNEHSAGAAEMVAAFAQENALARIVGTRTAGRLVGASSFKVGHGYRLALPVAAYFTWRDANLDGVGITPDVPVSMPLDALRAGSDPQLARAVAALAS